MVLTALTLTVNGLGSQQKWSSLWKEVPHTDVLCLQEMHLSCQLEYSFALTAQHYNFFFSHSTTASGGVCIEIKQATGIKAVKTFEVKGHLLVLDLEYMDQRIRLINIYALNKSKERALLFKAIYKFFTPMYLLGDFNSVTDASDHHSGRCNSTTNLLSLLLTKKGLVEPKGGHLFSYTYQHPSLSMRKSRIDRIYITDHFSVLLRYTQSFSFTDHYGVGVFLPKSTVSGPRPWWFPLDLLQSQENVDHICFILSTFHPDNVIKSWENIKNSLQKNTQRFTAYCQKLKAELAGLHQTLQYINK